MNQKFIIGLSVLFTLVWVAGCNRSNVTVVKPKRSTSTAEAPAADKQAPANRAAANRGTSRRSAANNSRGQKSGSQKNSGASNNKPPTRDDIANNEDLPDQVRERFDKNKKGGRDRSK